MNPACAVGVVRQTDGSGEETVRVVGIGSYGTDVEPGVDRSAAENATDDASGDVTGRRLQQQPGEIGVTTRAPDGRRVSREIHLNFGDGTDLGQGCVRRVPSLLPLIVVHVVAPGSARGDWEGGAVVVVARPEHGQVEQAICRIAIRFDGVQDGELVVRR